MMTTEMKVSEKPILFSGPMVRAILEWRKTQTRRVVKLNCSGRIKAVGSHMNWHPEDPNAIRGCPYGQPGDRLWVRETWAPNTVLPLSDRPHGDAIYRADGVYSAQWKPSIHMPRGASRITLEVTGVRVERLQDITEEDAEAEGMSTSVVNPSPKGWKGPLGYPKNYVNSRELFAHYWDCNAKRGFGWDANPWVWGIEFRRIEP